MVQGDLPSKIHFGIFPYLPCTQIKVHYTGLLAFGILRVNTKKNVVKSVYLSLFLQASDKYLKKILYVFVKSTTVYKGAGKIGLINSRPYSYIYFTKQIKTMSTECVNVLTSSDQEDVGHTNTSIYKLDSGDEHCGRRTAPLRPKDLSTARLL